MFKGELGKFRGNLPYLMLEVVLIFLSVVLAFSMGRWQDKLDKRERVEVALQNIKTEIIRNRDQIEPLIEIHKNLFEKAYQIPDSMFKNSNAFELFIYASDDQNPQLPWVEKSAFEAAVFSGVLQNMDIELLTHISSLYNLQNKGIDSLFKQFSEIMGEPSIYTNERTEANLQAILMILQSMYWNEKSYLEQCDTLLVKIDEFQ